MRSFLPLTVAFLASVSGFLMAPAHAAVINGVDFTTVYDATTLPDASTPAWTKNVGQGSASVSGGILTTTTAATETNFYSLDATPWSPDGDGTTVEVKLKIDSLASGASYAAQVFFGNGTRYYNFQFGTGSIMAGSLSTTFDTTAGFATYRMTLSSGGLANLYINNSTTAAITGYTGQASTADRIYFGDASNSTGGQAQWDYLAFTNDGATAPVPEPSSLALVGLTMVLGAVFGRRRR